MQITSCSYTELGVDERQQLETIVADEFGGIPIVRATEWAQADISYRGSIDEQLVCFYNLVFRDVFMDDRTVKVGGLNNLITVPQFRGNGWGAQLLRRTAHDWFQRFDVEYGLLLCADELVPLYSRLGWQPLNSTVTFDQANGTHTWTANCMVFGSGEIEEPKSLHLNGFPW